MKKTAIFYTSIFFLFSILAFGQNSFPASGNVGIGTLTPTYNLDVIGSINATELFLNGTEIQNTPWSILGNNVFYNTGNVGIGTNNPNFNLDVAGSLNATSIFLNGSALESPIWSLNGNEVFYNTGNVGVGTNDPNFTLDVNGSMNATSIFLNGSAITSSQWTTLTNDISYTTGNVGIGTTNTQGYMLAVAGNVIAEGVKVELEGNWPDFVFEKEFNLMELDEVKKFINKNRHLPNIPSAKNVKQNGIDLGIMDAKLLQKIEELTLYIIRQQEEIDSLKTANLAITNQNRVIKVLSERIERMEKSLKN